jgi:hypothetical protein
MFKNAKLIPSGAFVQVEDKFLMSDTLLKRWKIDIKLFCEAR